MKSVGGEREFRKTGIELFAQKNNFSAHFCAKVHTKRCTASNPEKISYIKEYILKIFQASQKIIILEIVI